MVVTLSEQPQALPREGLISAFENLDEKTKSILIVDDNSFDALHIRRFLEARKPYWVFHSIDNREGLVQACQRQPDLIILDLTLPEMDGFMVLEALRSAAGENPDDCGQRQGYHRGRSGTVEW